MVSKGSTSFCFRSFDLPAAWSLELGWAGLGWAVQTVPVRPRQRSGVSDEGAGRPVWYDLEEQERIELAGGGKVKPHTLIIVSKPSINK